MIVCLKISPLKRVFFWSENLHFLDQKSLPKKPNISPGEKEKNLAFLSPSYLLSLLWFCFCEDLYFNLTISMITKATSISVTATPIRMPRTGAITFCTWPICETEK